MVHASPLPSCDCGTPTPLPMLRRETGGRGASGFKEERGSPRKPKVESESKQLGLLQYESV